MVNCFIVIRLVLNKWLHKYANLFYRNSGELSKWLLKIRERQKKDCESGKPLILKNQNTQIKSGMLVVAATPTTTKLLNTFLLFYQEHCRYRPLSCFV